MCEKVIGELQKNVEIERKVMRARTAFHTYHDIDDAKFMAEDISIKTERLKSQV